MSIDVHVSPVKYSDSDYSGLQAFVCLSSYQYDQNKTSYLCVSPGLSQRLEYVYNSYL